ncbi:hypothetical protein EO244_02265 [Ancylomarina salipaludis]|uniref:Calx-beta domain-containing protein n=1 Tax=Ancylomarina salipaludis TaxID=2501299 RepID=A0A4Q1JQK4_9BACT|nr:hypothetical protein [Ancylomarina salipaludis]RXQ97729.1 hypothetical protein EO244_02265 [Ancylomarina salipaludis]
MKKLLLSLFICLGIIMISTQTFAQNNPGEKLQPYNGATYDYTFNGIQQGLLYEFYFSNSADGINKVGEIAAMASSMTGATGTVGSDNKATVSVEWPSNAAGTYATGLWLFVHVKDADESTICHNYNAVFIQPIANNFDVLVTNDKTGDATTSDVCPDISGLKAVVAPTPGYEAGTTTMNFTFNRSGSTNNWNLAYSIGQVGTGNYTYSFNGGTPVEITVNDNTTNIPSALVSGDAQTLQIVLDNVPGERPEFTITVTSATDAVTSVSAKTPNANVVETVKIMPVIGSFE